MTASKITLSGSKTNGVPEGLKNTAIPFVYDDVDSLEKAILNHKDAGVICIEGKDMIFKR